MFDVRKRDGKVVPFDISKISAAIKSAFESQEVNFNPDMIDDIVKHLKSFDDADIRKKIEKKPELMLQIVHEYFYCG